MNSNEDWTLIYLWIDPNLQFNDDDPVGQLVPDPEEQVQPGLGPVVANPGQPGSGQLGAGPEEQTQPEQVPGQPDQLQLEVQELAPLLKPSPRKRPIKERWIMKQ